MMTQTQRLPQPNSGAATAVDTAAESERKPIQAGVDSHKIDFSLNSTHAEKVKTVVGASFDSQTNNDFLAGIAPRLSELCSSGATLVSFASTNSFERLVQQNKPTQLRRNSTSIIERIQASLTSNNGNGLKLSDDITVMGMRINQRNTDTSGIPCLEGEIEVSFSDPQREYKTIKFLEFSPEYDGYSLDANTLLNALQHVSNKNADGVPPHFYSMNGIGRSASLAVLYAFKKMCSENNGGFNQADVKSHLNSLISQGRQQRNKYFVNTARQETELLNACITLNNSIRAEQKRGAGEDLRQYAGHSEVARSVHTPPVASTAGAAPQRAISISKTIKSLATDKPVSISNPQGLPYMPVNLAGVGDIAADTSKFSFPKLNTEQANRIGKDIVLAGFYGDALGADLEARLYADKTQILVGNMSNQTKTAFRNASSATQRDALLVQQLKQNNGRPSEIRHQATDDTQQGVLSAIAKMRWMLSGASNLDELAKQTMKAFHRPQFPAQNQKPDEKPTIDFGVRGGANTYYMCKFNTKPEGDWRDVAIEDIAIQFDRNRRPMGIARQGVRAGGAGNGGLMRIGYDILPLLASNASVQDLVEQVLISNQLTHPSSFSAVVSVGQSVLMAKCIDLRIKAERAGVPLSIPSNFFLDAFHDVAVALEHPAQKFGLHPTLSFVPNKYQSFSADEWRGTRLPSEFLKASDKSTEVIKAGSVEQALEESPKLDVSSEHVDSILKRWSSNSYLGATFPSIVFLLEKFGREDPARAVNMAALVTKDSDTCATIIAQVMGALHGSEWVEKERESCRSSDGQSTFNEDLGGGFEVSNFLGYLNDYYDLRAKLRSS